MSDLHQLVAGFHDAANYERARPGYTAETIAPILEGLGLRPGDRVADVGAGTGKLTRPLIEAGLDVVAVEPFAPMREELLRTVDPARILDGRAEEIPLPDGSLDAITAGSAFHWFDADRALPEFHRLLRPGGGVAICSIRPAWRSGDEPWAREIRELMMGSRPAHPHSDGPSIEDTFARVGGFEPLRLVTAKDEMRVDRPLILDGIASASWVGAMSADERAELLGRVERVLADAGVDEMVQELRMETRLTRAI